MSDYEERECGVTLTIENRLGLYANEKREERNEILWYVWQQNKRWLSNILDWILPSFPNYSMHDKSHSFSVLHNIEMLLGECQVKKLSATDCFMILHVVYLHDIGMCITASDRSELMKNPDFIQFLQYYEEKGDAQTRQYANLLLKHCSELGMGKSTEEVLKIKLDMYYAMIFLVAEYVRKEHATNSRALVEKWMGQSEKMGLGYGFSYSGIPQRLFHMVGACACVHNSLDFNDVMDLPKIDDGFAHDYIHPRFIAVLLQLGDSLDLDNDRFHPLIKEVVGKLPWESEKHYEKHKAIRRLRISPLKITVAADCSSPEALRQINKECNCIKTILQNAAYHWSAICPDDMDARLPNFEPVELRMNGKIISDRLINAEFKIQQKKAFNLLQGANFYKDEKFVFLRELFQNAVDASKMQYWIDWIGSRWNGAGDGDIQARSFTEMGKMLPFYRYPIVVEFHLAKKEKNTGKITCLDTKDSVGNNTVDIKNFEYGAYVWVIDFGTGMSEKDLLAIADVGTSYEVNEKKRKGMPSWLLPTAEFGIGLQSVFLIADSFVAYTHTHSGERFRLEFFATGDKGNGHIHVTPLDEEKLQHYGTKVGVFVPCTEKKKHQQELKTWCGKDPFSDDYAEERPFRHARELVVQMATSLDSMLGERLFPIEIRLYDYVGEGEQIYSRMLSKEIKNLYYKIYLNDKNVVMSTEKVSLEAREGYVAWPVYEGHNKENIIRGNVEHIEYMFDCEHMKFYIYDYEHHNVYARFGAERLLDMWQQTRRYAQDDEEHGTKVYYKGIYVEHREWTKDANLLEYIDIKEKIARKYLRINRCEFTSEGQLYLEEQVYPHILESARKVLLHCDYVKVINQIKGNLNRMEEEKDNPCDESREYRIYNAILAATGLAFFAQIRKKDSWESMQEKEAAGGWNELFNDISNVINKGMNNTKEWANSSMFQIRVIKLKKREDQLEYNNKEKINIAQLLNRENKYVIMSVRKTARRSWTEFLIQLDSASSNTVEGKNNTSDILPYIMRDYAKLESERSWEERKQLLIEVEKEGDKLLNLCKKIAEEDATVYLKNENTEEDVTLNLNNEIRLGKWDKILKWILYNIPSTEIFFSKDFNLRINVLGLEYSNEIYLNRHIRNSIWEKMEKIYKERTIERFSTIVPCGYSALGIYDKEKSVYYVKRGFFLYVERPYVINPFVGEVMGKVSGQLEEIKGNMDADTYDKKIDNIVNQLIESLSLEKKNGVIGNLLDYVTRKSNMQITDIECLNLYKEYLKEWIYMLGKC